MSMDYETLSLSDQLLLARDLLRAKESDHFRLSLVEEPNTASRLEQLLGQIEELKGKVSELETQASEESDDPTPKKAPRRRSTGPKK